MPILLNGKSEESFPPFIHHSSTIRIEETSWRKAGIWNEQETYENQGLQKGFFKLLKRLWATQECTIRIIEEKVYNDYIQALQSKSEPESAEAFESFIEKAVRKARGILL